ncbi:hypothetical protein HK413_12685 [Mucilaginibacter sp. S1162]|uniref:Uncharacterized protein n=1 Tax=Mucilaginibacter humi TaxID=2732510 RepID=A0ABX1W7M5_9SPHI|nr:hypothetical protein [Mucilaginibacter humi]NNU34702.1 hypothetical protein [Mucilaginibacter humi]
MDTKIFKYSVGQMVWGIVVFPLLYVIMYCETITSNSDFNDWLILGGITLIMGSRFIYLCVMYYIPCFQDKPALSLDEEKLQCFITGKLLLQVTPDILYWKDIEEINYTYIYRKGALISFKMKTPESGIYKKYSVTDDSGFYTTYISGDKS